VAGWAGRGDAPRGQHGGRPYLDVLLTYHAPSPAQAPPCSASRRLRYRARCAWRDAHGWKAGGRDGDDGLFFKGLTDGPLKGILLVHVREETHPSEARFRDKLRSDPEQVEQYKELTMMLAREASTVEEYSTRRPGGTRVQHTAKAEN
jgi:hypothetical protein